MPIYQITPSLIYHPLVAQELKDKAKWLTTLTAQNEQLKQLEKLPWPLQEDGSRWFTFILLREEIHLDFSYTASQEPNFPHVMEAHLQTLRYAYDCYFTHSKCWTTSLKTTIGKHPIILYDILPGEECISIPTGETTLTSVIRQLYGTEALLYRELHPEGD